MLPKPVWVFRCLPYTKINKIYLSKYSIFEKFNSSNTYNFFPKSGLWPTHKHMRSLPSVRASPWTGNPAYLFMCKCEPVYMFETSITDVAFLYNKKNLSKWCEKMGVSQVVSSTYISKAIHLKYDERWTMSILTLFQKLFPTLSLKSKREMMLSKQSLYQRSVLWSRITLFQRNTYLFFLAAHWLSSGLLWWKYIFFFN